MECLQRRLVIFVIIYLCTPWYKFTYNPSANFEAVDVISEP